MKIFVRRPVTVKSKKITPSRSVNTMQLAYVKPVVSLTKEKQINALIPMPDACAKGIFAKKAISIVPTIAPIAVAM